MGVLMHAHRGHGHSPLKHAPRCFGVGGRVRPTKPVSLLGIVTPGRCLWDQTPWQHRLRRAIHASLTRMRLLHVGHSCHVSSAWQPAHGVLSPAQRLQLCRGAQHQGPHPLWCSTLWAQTGGCSLAARSSHLAPTSAPRSQHRRACTATVPDDPQRMVPMQGQAAGALPARVAQGFSAQRQAELQRLAECHSRTSRLHQASSATLLLAMRPQRSVANRCRSCAHLRAPGPVAVGHAAPGLRCQQVLLMC